MTKHYEENLLISESPEKIFAFIDDHASFSSHMNQSSWMMGGGKMNTQIDSGHGQEVGSHIRMSGEALGISLSLDEVVTKHEPPFLKAWETVGEPKLLVIGNYGMKVKIEKKDSGSLVNVSIDYDLPSRHVWLGKLFGRIFAKWCARQMTYGVRDHFAK